MITARKSIPLAALLMTGVLALALPGCAPVVLPATQHAPSAASQVQLYQKQPAKYEALGTITALVTPEMKWDEHCLLYTSPSPRD